MLPDSPAPPDSQNNKRFEHPATGPSKIDAKIRFPMQLDMTPYTTRARRKTISKLAPDGVSKTATRPSGLYMYDLLSVVVHMGQISSGHYVSYSRENGQVGYIPSPSLGFRRAWKKEEVLVSRG